MRSSGPFFFAPASLRSPGRRCSAAALLIVLLALSLMTIIVLGILGTMTWEMASSRSDFENQKAQAMATLAFNTAMANLRNALGPWDNPYANFATNAPTFYWSVSPGIISHWSYTNATPEANYPLFSSGSTNLVNLNTAKSDGTYPIAGGTSPPNISVYWANVLRNPANPVASATNQLIGRYAFWVDDENAKININTADGTLKYQTNSLGIGSPSEVSLQALQEGGAPLSTGTASNIVYVARTTGFNSPSEILRAAGTTSDLYEDNVFSLTAYSRSPDINMFGQPKMVITPLLGGSLYYNSVQQMVMNSITLRPPTEIYPTPSQLPTYYPVIPIDPSIRVWNTAYTTPTPEPYPIAFRAVNGLNNAGLYYEVEAHDSADAYRKPYYPWQNGMLLAQYLAGTNAAFQPITWPPFQGSSAEGFAGKYTPRQIDSIVCQICSFGSKLISPDVCGYSDSDTDGPAVEARTIITPFIFWGWLSNQWVSGIGRVPKVDAMEVSITTSASSGDPVNAPQSYVPAQAEFCFWQEWWLPAADLGGNPTSGIVGIYQGVRGDQNTINTSDYCYYTLYNNGATNEAPPAYEWPGAYIPKADDISSSYWGNQLLNSDQGIDFQGNPQDCVDPDQTLAKEYHPWTYSLANGAYMGTGYMPQQFTGPLQMGFPEDPTFAPPDWAPGALRCICSFYGPGFPMPLDMQTNAGTASAPTLDLTGGLQVRGELTSAMMSDPDPVPLESFRGPGCAVNGEWSGEGWTDPGSPGSSTNLRDRYVQMVVPLTNVSVKVPAPNSGDAGLGYQMYAMVTVADPLVNKFPGDWTVTTNATNPLGPSYWQTVQNFVAPATNTEYAVDATRTKGFHGLLGDPDSYWVPQADVPACYFGQVASNTLIPRSARFPNIGYLQYVRTGIIPDDETRPVPQQHGTPFRLLSLGPCNDSTDTNQVVRGVNYPDWAMLDLFQAPSILASYGGPYGYYQTNGVWQGYGNPTVMANNSTEGGSTPGRINPNGAMIYTTNANIPQPGVSRTLPLQALLQGLTYNQSLINNPSTPNPGYTGTSVDATNIATAVYNYLTNNGPMRIPGEICNVPEIAALRPTVNLTRNDLVRQIVGALTTQSDTFSIWVEGQSINKAKGNSNYGVYEAGDQISSVVRYHYVIERYLDPGADGIYGNAGNGGGDGIVGTFDDPVDPVNHPFCPRYLYRVVSAEEVR